MDDRSNVLQKPIRLQVANMGQLTESVIGFSVPFPPEGCESQQLIEIGSVTAIIYAGHIGLTGKLRAIQAYANIWDIEIVRQSLADFAASTEAEKAETAGQ